jgi:predicted acetyltransferase
MWVPVSYEYLDHFEEMLAEYAALGEAYLPYSAKLGEWWDDPSEYITFWQKLRTDALPDLNLVRTDSLWLLENSRIVGDVRLRHTLNENLSRNGGHIGYCVRPRERNRGLATSILGFALSQARSLGLDKVLLTCDSQNTPSIRVIEKNGGIFMDDCVLDNGSINKRFWISLS